MISETGVPHFLVRSSVFYFPNRVDKVSLRIEYENVVVVSGIKKVTVDDVVLLVGGMVCLRAGRIIKHVLRSERVRIDSDVCSLQCECTFLIRFANCKLSLLEGSNSFSKHWRLDVITDIPLMGVQGRLCCLHPTAGGTSSDQGEVFHSLLQQL